MANNEIVLDLIEAGEIERAKHVVAWLIWAAKAYGVKAVNPGGVAAWKWGKDAKGLHRAGRTATARSRRRKIIAGLGRHRGRAGPAAPAAPALQQPRRPGNFTTTLETMKVLEGNRAHLAHLQYHAYGGDDWPTMRSGGRRRSPRSSTRTRT